MRKFSLVLAALLVVASGAFAQVSIEPTIEVKASATFGVQLDEMTTGITNSAESNLTFTFTEEQTAEYGEGDVYGYIKLEDFKIELDSAADDATDNGALDVSVGAVTGKVMLGPAYIALDDATTGVNEAEAFALINQTLVGYISKTATTFTTEDTSDPGVAFGVALPDVATVEFGVASASDWTTPTTNDTNSYVMSIDAEITAVEATTIAVVSTMAFGDTSTADAGAPGTNNNPVGVGISAQYDMPMGDITASPVVGFDLTSEENAAGDALRDMEIGAGVKLSWAALGLDEDDDDHIDFLGQGGATDPENEEVTSGAYLGAVYTIDQQTKDEAVNSMTIRAGLFEDSGDDGLLPVVGAAFMVDYTSTFENKNVGQVAQSDLGIGVEVNADLGVVSPYAGFKYITEDMGDNTTTGTVDFATMNVGTDINVIPNTTFTVDYASGDLTLSGDGTYGNTYGYNNSSAAKLGVVTIKTEVSF